MKYEIKYHSKTSFRLNDRIKDIITRTCRELSRETGLKLSLGKLSRAFWISLASDRKLRKDFIDNAAKALLEEAGRKDFKYNARKPKYGHSKRGYRKSNLMP